MSSPSASGCAHSPRPHTICFHLLDALAADGEGDPPGFQVRFAGSDATPICSVCLETPDAAPSIVPCCDACWYAYLEIDLNTSFSGFIGEPAPRERDAGITLAVETVDARAAVRDRVLEMAPIPGSGRARWLLWTASRRLAILELPAGEVHWCGDPLREELLPDPKHVSEWQQKRVRTTLRVSPDGRFVALLEETTRYGLVVETATGAPVLALDRGDYHPDVSDWPFAWHERDGHMIAIHAVAWNELASTDVTAGKPIARPREEGVDGPDYFLGALALSPDAKYLATSGWVWHPVGQLLLLRTDTLLSPDGVALTESYTSLSFTADWDRPMLWLDSRRILVWGVGDGDSESRLTNAGLVYELDDAPPVPGVTPRRARAWWPGLPCGPLFLDRAHGRVIAAAPDGTSLWDASTGDRLCLAPGFVARGLHPATGLLAGIADPEGAFSLGFLQRKP